MPADADDGATSPRGPASNDRRNDRLLLLASLVFAGLTFASVARTLELRITLLGWGPQDYVNQVRHPERYEKNWPNGTHIYDFSLPMRFYRAAAAAGVTPTTAMYPHVLLEVVLFTLAAGFLAHTLFRNPAVTAVCVVLALCSPLVGLNLGRFGTGFGSSLHALFYGYAHAFRLLAIACFLRRWWFAGFGLLALTFLFHFTLGLYAAIFVGAMTLVTPRDILRPRFLVGAIGCAGVVLALAIGVSRHATLSTGVLATQDWLDAGRVFQSHFFPASREMFGRRAHQELIPVVTLVLCLVGAVRFGPADPRIRLTQTRVLAGCGSAAALTIAGLVIASWMPVPFLVKLCLHRSSDLLTLFATFSLAWYLLDVIRRRGLGAALLSGYAIAAMVFARPGLAVLPLLIVFAGDVWARRPRDETGAARRPAGAVTRGGFAVIAGLVLVAATAAITGGRLGGTTRRLISAVWDPLRRFDPFVATDGFDLLVRGGQFQVALPWLATLAAATALVLVVRIPRRHDDATCSHARLATLLVVCAATVGYARGMRETTWLWRYGARAVALREAQDWACEHTAPTSLFMIDPAHAYGWRDFSQRSSLGTLREWGMTAFLYDPDADRYAEGQRRLALFGVDFRARVRVSREAGTPLGRLSREITDDVRTRFATMTEDEFTAIARRYDVDYLVDPAPADARRRLRFPVVFENRFYAIYAFDAAPSSSSASTSRATMRR